MTIQERVRMCQLIEQMQRHAGYAQSIGIENKSSFIDCKQDTSAKKAEKLSHCLK